MSFTKTKIIKDGATYAEYHRQDAKRGDRNYSMSRSELVDLALCPAKWIATAPGGDESTDATKWGSILDCLLTSKEQFESLYVMRPDTYPDAKTGEAKKWTMASNWCKAWAEEHKDREMVSFDERLELAIAVKAIEASVAGQLIAESRKQLLIVGFWTDKATGIEIPVRGLLDLVPPKDHPEFGKWICDFKTARNGNPATWARTVADSNYDVQAALYMDLYAAATGEDRTDFVHVVQENVAPYHVVSPMPALTSEFLEWGRLKYRAALAKYAQCLATGEWPSYAPAGQVYGHTQWIEPKELWAYKQTAGGANLGAMARASEPSPESDYASKTGDLVP